MVTSLRQRSQFLVKLIVYSRLYLAVGSLLLVYGLTIVLGVHFEWGIGISVFFTIFAAYAMNRKSDMAEDEINVSFGTPELAEKTFYAGLISLVAAVIVGAMTNFWIVIVIGVFMGMLIVYSVKLLPDVLPYTRLKEVPFVKNSVVGGALAFLFIAPLIVYYNLSLTIEVAVLFGFVFLRTFIGSVIPDIRDIEGDKNAGVDTIPVLFGISRTKSILLLINTLAVIIFYGSIIGNYLPIEAAFAGIVNLIGFPIIYYTTERNAGKMTLITEINDSYLFFALAVVGGMV